MQLPVIERPLHSYNQSELGSPLLVICLGKSCCRPIATRWVWIFSVSDLSRMFWSLPPLPVGLKITITKHPPGQLMFDVSREFGKELFKLKDTTNLSLVDTLCPIEMTPNE